MIENQARPVGIGIHKVRKKVKMSHICPLCKERVRFGIEQEVLDSVQKYPFTHCVLHGEPVHALIAYIDANLMVRGIEHSSSIEISRDGTTFSQLLRNWSNPT